MISGVELKEPRYEEGDLAILSALKPAEVAMSMMFSMPALWAIRMVEVLRDSISARLARIRR